MCDADGRTDTEIDQTTLCMPATSRYAGQPIDLSSRRSIVILTDSDTDSPIDPGDDRVVVDYFYHEGRYWRAVIPLGGVHEVFGQSFNFSKPKTQRGANGPEILYDKHGVPKPTIRMLSHLQCRFTLKPSHSVDLYPLESEADGTPTHQLNDFIYSVEISGPADVAFNVRDGLAGNFISAHRLLSTREMVFERLVVESQYVSESPALPLDDLQKRAVLTESLLRSHRAGHSEIYYLCRICGTNNCTSGPFQILDTVIDYSLMQRIGSLLYRLPLSPRFYLRVRGMDSDPSHRKLLRPEFEDYIQSEEARNRKREYVRSLGRARRNAREATDE